MSRLRSIYSRKSIYERESVYNLAKSLFSVPDPEKSADQIVNSAIKGGVTPYALVRAAQRAMMRNHDSTESSPEDQRGTDEAGRARRVVSSSRTE